MPGFVTHYIFGRETYGKLKSESLKKNIYEHHAVYALGLQGPDLFFYYLPSYVLHGRNIGALAHTSESRTFFYGLLQSCLRFTQPADRMIAKAYLMGFLGHYTLDTICHPYIYSMTHYAGKQKDYFARHAYLETDIDTALLNIKLRRNPCNFHSANTIVLTHRQKKVVARMLYDAFHYAFPEMKFDRLTMYFGIFSMRLGLRILHDNSGKKKVLFRFIEKHCLGYPLFSPLIPSDTLFFRTDPFNIRHSVWKNPWDSSIISTESFFDLYEKSQTLYLSRMEKLDVLLATDKNDTGYKKLLLDFFADYKNLSFHSGLDVSIPS